MKRWCVMEFRGAEFTRREAEALFFLRWLYLTGRVWG